MEILKKYISFLIKEGRVQLGWTGDIKEFTIQHCEFPNVIVGYYELGERWKISSHQYKKTLFINMPDFTSWKRDQKIDLIND